MFKLTQKSPKDTGVSINTKESFPTLVFKKGDKYYVSIDGLDNPLYARATRGGQTLYTGKLTAEVRENLRKINALPSLPKKHVFVKGGLAKFLRSA